MGLGLQLALRQRIPTECRKLDQVFQFTGRLRQEAFEPFHCKFRQDVIAQQLAQFYWVLFNPLMITPGGNGDGFGQGDRAKVFNPDTPPSFVLFGYGSDGIIAVVAIYAFQARGILRMCANGQYAGGSIFENRGNQLFEHWHRSCFFVIPGRRIDCGQVNYAERCDCA